MSRKSRTYHWLLIKDGAPGDPWGIAFGSYDKDDVTSERDEFRDKGWKRSEVCIVTCNNAKQKTIDELVAGMNEA